MLAEISREPRKARGAILPPPNEPPSALGSVSLRRQYCATPFGPGHAGALPVCDGAPEDAPGRAGRGGSMSQAVQRMSVPLLAMLPGLSCRRRC